jgi:hypothetical protein
MRPSPIVALTLNLYKAHPVNCRLSATYKLLLKLPTIISLHFAACRDSAIFAAYISNEEN